MIQFTLLLYIRPGNLLEFLGNNFINNIDVPKECFSHKMSILHVIGNGHKYLYEFHENLLHVFIVIVVCCMYLLILFLQ